MVCGSIVGSLIPACFGAEWFSLSSIIGGLVGGLAGIYVAFRLLR
jgi:hypothetical protein